MYGLKKVVSLLSVLMLLTVLFPSNSSSAQEEAKSETAQVRGQLFYLNETGGLCVVEECINVILRNLHTYEALPPKLSDPYGYFSFLDVTPGYYMLEIDAQQPNKTLYFRYDSEPFRLEAGDTFVKNITLSAKRLNAHLVGKVVDDSPTPNPVPNAKVILLDKGRNYQSETKTNQKGEFELAFYDGTYSLIIEGTGEFEKYSYSGEITLAGDGERSAKLAEYPVVNWTENNRTEPQLVLKKGDRETKLVYGKDYEIVAPTGEVVFKNLKLENYNKVIAKRYHHLKRGPLDDVNETLDLSWDGKKFEYELNYTYDIKKYFGLGYSFAGKTNKTTNTTEVWQYKEAYDIKQVETGIGVVRLTINKNKANLTVGETIWVNYAYKEREKEYQKEVIMESYDPDVGDQYNLSWGHILKGYGIYKDEALTKTVDQATYTFDRFKGIFYVTDWRNFPKRTAIYIGRFATTEREIKDECVLTSGRTNAGTITLSKYYIGGQAVDAETKAAINNTKIIMSLWDKTEKRLLQKELMASTLSMSIPESQLNNEFVLLIHPEGYDSHLRKSYKPSPPAARSLHDVLFNRVKDADKDLINTTITFPNITDWNNISLKKTISLNWWSSIKGLKYENVGNVRFQIDLNYEPDTEISEAEINNLRDWLENRTPSFVVADIGNVLVIDNKRFYSKHESTNVLEIEGLIEEDSYIDSTKPVRITTVVVCNTTGDEKIKPSEQKYTLKLYVEEDTATTNHTYYLQLPKFYEVVDSDAQPDKVRVIGSTNVTIDPLGWSGWVTLTIQNTRNATARAKIIAWNYGNEDEKYAYKVEGENYSYIVARYKNITFSAEDSKPDGGTILWHRWKIADRDWSEEIKWSANKTWVANFSEVFHNNEVNFTVALEIMDSGGNVSRTWNATENRNLTVRVDEVPPSAKLRVYFLEGDKEKSIKITNNTIFVNVGDEINFNGSASNDTLTYAPSWNNSGVIRTYLYIYGDGNKTYQNNTKPVKYAYSKAGIYTAILNITDAVGFTNETNITVYVKPKPEFTMKDEKGNEIRETRERLTVFLNASKSIGPTEDTIQYLNWSLEHQTEKHLKYTNFGRNVTLNYTFGLDTIGNWNITLNVTDKLGNYAVQTKVLYVAMGKRPDLTVGAINFSADAAEEGSKVVISANISNCFARLPEESYLARNITVRFYHDKNNDGIADPEELIEGTVRFYNGTNTTRLISEGTLSQLGVKEWVIAKIEWIASGAGRNQTIIVNATCANESATTMRDNEAMGEIRVVPAAWTRIWTIIGIIIIIVVILAVVYLWKTGRLKRVKEPEEVVEKRKRLEALGKRYEARKEKREKEKAKRRAKW